MGLSNYVPSSRISQAGVVANTADRPASPYAGQLVYQLDTKQLLVYDGYAWVMAVDADAPPGLQLIGGVGCSSGGTASNGVVTVGTSVSSVTITNAFSSEYDNYRLMIEGVDGPSGDNILGIQFGSTAANYYSSIYRDRATDANVTTSRTNNGANIFIGMLGATTDTLISLDIGGPNMARRTTTNGTYSGGAVAGWSGGLLADTTQYTAFTILVASGSGTMTGGTIRVYGYRNSR